MTETDYRLINLDKALTIPTDYPFLDDADLNMLRTSEAFLVDKFQTCNTE